MKNTYKVRIHSGRIKTKYGVCVASFVDDPNNQKYKGDDVEEKLMEMLSYTKADDESSEHPGYYDDYVGAYFDYDGYIDVDIPESIVNDILRKEVS